MKIFIVISGSTFVGEMIQHKYSGLNAEDYCQVWNGFLFINDQEEFCSDLCSEDGR